MARWGCVWGVGLAALVGCAGDAGTPDTSDTGTAPPSCSDGDLGLVVGTGVSAFAALNTGDPVTMVHGPQGGWHIELAGLVSGATGEVSVHPEASVPGLGGLQIVGEQQANFLALSGYDDTTCSGTFVNVRAFIDYEQDTGPSGLDFICSLVGQTLSFGATVSDIGGAERSVTTFVDVVADPDPADADDCAGL